MRARVWLIGLGGTLVASALLAPPALAHGLVGRTDLPIPRWLFGWGAAMVLIVSFVALAVLWQKPELQEGHRRRLVRVPAALDVVCGVLGIGMFAAVVYSGLAGTQTATANLAPTVIYVVVWVGLVIVSLFCGDVFALFNPWRATARGVAWIAGRVAPERLPAPLEYPARVGRWPAAVGVVAFVWVELIYPNRDDPSILALLALAYAAVMLLGMSFYGIDRWTSRADAFAVYFNLFARLSPWERRDGVLYLRRPLSGVTQLEPAAGTVALVVAMIGTTTFDGFTQGPIWRDLLPDLERPLLDLGMSLTGALQVAATIGLLVVVGLVALLYRAGVAGMHSVSASHGARDLAQSFAHTLVPIAAAYAIAHYFSLLAYQGQATAFLVSDPLGDGSNLFGTASATIDYNVIRATGVWYVQVGALVIGHVAALILAHDRALVVWRKAREATRSQYWMLLVMVGFTSLGLWLLSAANPT